MQDRKTYLQGIITQMKSNSGPNLPITEGYAKVMQIQDEIDREMIGLRRKGNGVRPRPPYNK